jgi:hypothetical protein
MPDASVQADSPVVRVTQSSPRVGITLTQAPPLAFTYEHDQPIPAAVWDITHSLGGHPSVTVVDSADTQCFGRVVYVSDMAVQVIFSAPFAGKAYLS